MQKPKLQDQATAQVGRQSAKPQRSTKRDRQIVVRASQEEYDMIQSFFEDGGLPMATGIRQVVLQHIRRQGGGR